MCRHPNVSRSTNKQLIESIVKEELTLECPICYDAFDSDNLFFTECKHYACIKCTDMIKKNLRSTRHIYQPSLGYFQDYDEYIGQLPASSRDPFIQIIIYNNIINNNINIDNNNIDNNIIDIN